MLQRNNWRSAVTWKKGAAKSAILNAGKQILRARNPTPNWSYFQKAAAWAEECAAAEVDDIETSWDHLSAEDLEWKISYANGLCDSKPADMILACSLSESPIETIVITWLSLFGTDGYNLLRFTPIWCGDTGPDVGTEWRPQVQFSGIRVDLLFRACFKGKYRLLAVECDGHDFHERTPEQASRDRSRDRRSFMNQIPTLRFTGREIVRDPDSCLSDIESALSERMEDLFHEAGIIPRRIPLYLKQAMTPRG